MILFPDVIILNGTSSSGKTTLAAALQEMLPEIYMCLSIDAFWGTLPQKAFAPDVIAQIGPSVVTGFHSCLAALASVGNKVIVDTVLAEKKWAEECLLILQPHQTLYVGVHCPLEELERREQARGDRALGLARHQWNHVHLHVPYDLEVSTLENSPEQCAEKILQHLVTRT